VLRWWWRNGDVIVAPSFRRPDGASLVELLIVMALVAVTIGMTVPLTARSIDASRARQAAGFLAGEFRRARQQAVSRNTSVGVVFDITNARWTFRLCVDGNGNGIRRADIARDTDLCIEGPYDLTATFPGVTIAVDAALPSPDGGVGKSDPVQFGNSNLASFSSSGTSTSGTVFVRSGGGEQYAVRVAGATGRIRLIHFDTGRAQWVDL
jgi:type II secretory pathway pseudopilin PulG